MFPSQNGFVNTNVLTFFTLFRRALCHPRCMASEHTLLAGPGPVESRQYCDAGYASTGSTRISVRTELAI
jgi:hypothetical protein